MKRATLFLFVALLCAAMTAAAQERPWTLTQCIEYAQKNNVSVQQRVLQIEDQNIQLSTSRYGRLPSLDASLSASASFGRSLTRDNTYADNTQVSGALGVSTSVPLFQGFRITRTIKNNKLALAAAVQDMERVREDVAINVMTLYLQALFCKELVAVAERQLALSTAQAERSRELVRTGRQAESTYYESEALRASDEVSLTDSRNNLTLALLDLSQALNRESAEGFDIEMPALDGLSLEAMHDTGSPDAVYDYAEANRPALKAERLRLQGSEQSLKIARSALYPTIALSAGYSTNLYKSYATGSLNTAFWTQFRNNGSEYVGISMSIPIFNRRATRNNIRSADVARRNQLLTLTQAEQSLRKEIEQAFYNADAAYGKYRSSESALDAARIAFTYEEEKAAAGRSTIFDFNDAKTRMEKAESDLLQAKYEFIFRSKILDFYRDIPISL